MQLCTCFLATAPSCHSVIMLQYSTVQGCNHDLSLGNGTQLSVNAGHLMYSPRDRLLALVVCSLYR